MKNLLFIFSILCLLFFSCKEPVMVDVISSEDNYIQGNFSLDRNNVEMDDRSIESLIKVQTESNFFEAPSNQYRANKDYTFNIRTDQGDIVEIKFSYDMYTDGEGLVVDLGSVGGDVPWSFASKEEITAFYTEASPLIQCRIFGHDNEALTALYDDTRHTMKVDEVETVNGDGLFLTYEMNPDFEMVGEYYELINNETFYRNFYVSADDFELGFVIDFDEF